MEAFRGLWSLGLFILLLQGCTPTATKQEVGKLQGDLGNVRVSQASVTAQLGSMDNRIRELQGDIEELKFSQHQYQTRELEQLRQQIYNIQRRLPPPSVVPIAALEEDEEFVARIEPTPGSLSRGLSAMRTGDFQAALASFEESANAYSQENIVTLIQFWLAVTNEGLGDLRKALSQYFELVQLRPKYNRAPLVLLREANLLMRLGDKKTASLIFKKLTTEYPKSAEADRAREKQKGM